VYICLHIYIYTHTVEQNLNNFKKPIRKKHKRIFKRLTVIDELAVFCYGIVHWLEAVRTS